jgi:hypothetical protein
MSRAKVCAGVESNKPSFSRHQIARDYPGRVPRLI